MRSPREVVDRVGGRFPLPDDPFDRLARRRERKRRNQRIAAGVLALVIVLAAAGLFARAVLSDGVPADRTPTPPPPEPTQTVSIDWDSVPGVSIDGDALVDIRTGEVTALPASITSFRDAGGYAVPPSGDVLLFEAGGDDVHRRPCDVTAPSPDCQIFVANLDGTDVRQLTDVPGGAMAGGWSPDGTTIVALFDGGSGRRDVDLVLIDVATGQTTKLADARGFSEPHFSRDGQLVLFGKYARHTFGIPVEGGDPAVAVEGHSNAFFSPDGRTIASSDSVSFGNMGGPQVWVADADGSRPRPLLDPTDPDVWPFSFSPSWSPDGTRLVLSKPLQDADPLVAVIDVASGTPTFAVRGTEQPAAVWIDDNTLLVDAGPAGFF